MEVSDSPELVIFDLDGVLMDTCELHFETLNAALLENGWKPISREEHDARYNGLPTHKKLELYGMPVTARASVSAAKQRATMTALEKLERDRELVSLFELLRWKSIRIAVASNARRETTELALRRLGLLSLVDFWITPETSTPKPSPAMYHRCMEVLGYSPAQTVIVEDSPLGCEGALASGARLVRVANRSEVTLERVLEGHHG